METKEVRDGKIHTKAEVICRNEIVSWIRMVPQVITRSPGPNDLDSVSNMSLSISANTSSTKQGLSFSG
ncbi:hypothetical protein CapIbe_000252 [Capra ibex]